MANGIQMPVSMMNSPTALPRRGFVMSSFGAGYGSGSNSFSPIVNAKLTIAMPATQRQRRDRSRPFGKTNATASGQANRAGGMVAASVWYAHAAPTSCSAAIWNVRQERSEQEDPRDAVARELEGDQEADDGRGQDREREERIDRERNPVLLIRGKDLEYLQQADRQRRERREGDAAGEDPKTAHPDIICLSKPEPQYGPAPR